MSRALRADERAALQAILDAFDRAPNSRYVGRGPVDWLRRRVGNVGGIACIRLATHLHQLGVGGLRLWCRLVCAGLEWSRWWSGGLWEPAA